jgi:trehalose 6-phosphate synthase
MPDTERRLIIVSNRLPLCLKKTDRGSYESSLSSGGLVTALSGLSSSTNVRWFGWPGTNIENDEERETAQKALGEQDAVGIFLDEELARKHYNEFSSACSTQLSKGTFRLEES